MDSERSKSIPAPRETYRKRLLKLIAYLGFALLVNFGSVQLFGLMWLIDGDPGRDLFWYHHAFAWIAILVFFTSVLVLIICGGRLACLFLDIFCTRKTEPGDVGGPDPDDS